MKGNLITLDQRPVLDLNYVHFQHQQGGILVLGSWYMDPDTRQSDPCLVLLDAKGRVRGEKVRPCVIHLRDLWRWAPAPTGDPGYMVECIFDWLVSGALPGNPNHKRDVFNVISAVHSRLSDLWSMPPLPEMAAIRNSAVPVGTMTITERESGKTVNEIEVMASNVRT